MNRIREITEEQVIVLKLILLREDLQYLFNNYYEKLENKY